MKFVKILLIFVIMILLVSLVNAEESGCSSDQTDYLIYDWTFNGTYWNGTAETTWNTIAGTPTFTNGYVTLNANNEAAEARIIPTNGTNDVVTLEYHKQFSDTSAIPTFWIRDSGIDAAAIHLIRSNGNGAGNFANYNASGPAWQNIDTGQSANTWYHVKVVINFTEQTSMISVDGSYKGTFGYRHTGHADVMDGIRLGIYSAGSGLFTNLSVYDGDTCPSPPVALDNGTGDLFFTNTSGNLSINKSTFDEGENFWIYGSWINDSGIIMNDTAGNCSAEWIEGLIETESSLNDFTLCNSGCNYSLYEENFTNQELTNAVMDELRFNACHVSTAQGTFTANITCDSGSYEETITPDQLPLCSSGSEMLLVNTSVCTSDENVTVYFEISVPNAQRKNISDMEFDRKFSVHTEILTFNTTLNLWEFATHSHEYYEHGNQTINLVCDHFTDGNISINYSEQITIANELPRINFNQVNTGTGTNTDLSDGVNIEYNNNVWEWLVSIVDDDLDSWAANFTNSSGDLMQTTTGSGSVNITTGVEFFLLFENPYNLTIWANDTAGDSTTSVLEFNVNDTTDPVITWIDPQNATNYDTSTISNIEFESRCSDLALHRMNVTVTDRNGSVVFSNQTTNILGILEIMDFDLGTGNFSASLNETDWHTVNTTCADSHTGNELKRLKDPTIVSNKYVFDDFILAINSLGVKDLSFNREIDRYTFEYNFGAGVDEIEYRVDSSLPIEFVDSEYCGHLVIGNFWIDFEPAISCNVRVFDEYALITASYSQKSTSFLTKSVGELNVVSESRYFATFDTSSLTSDWTGITCGEKYPDNFHQINFSGENFNNCTLHVNDYLHDEWTDDCGTVNITTNIGRQRIELEAVNSLGNNITDDCTIWTDKEDKELGDFLWIILTVVLCGFLMWFGFRYYGLFVILAGLVSIWFGYELFAYSWVVGTFTMCIGFILMLWEVFKN